MTLAFFFGASFARQGRPFYDGKHGLMSYPTDAHVGDVSPYKKITAMFFFATTSN